MRKLKKRAIDFDIFCFLMAYILIASVMLFGGIFLNTDLVAVGVLIDLIFVIITDIVLHVFEEREEGVAILMLLAINIVALMLGLIFHLVIC